MYDGGVDIRVAEVFEPTCTICGLTAGYRGPGSKTVLPAQSSAWVDFRLVPDQNPEHMMQLPRTHLDAEGFSDVLIELVCAEGLGRTDPDHPFVKMVIDTSKEVYGSPMRMEPMVGGSGLNAVFLETLKLPIVSEGIGYPGAQVHAPNENNRLDLYLKGARHIARMLKAF